MRASSVALVISFTALAPAIAAGPFDGQWGGGSPSVNAGSHGNCPATIAKATVADNKLTRAVAFGIGSYTITGTIAPDGAATGVGPETR